MRLSIVVAFSLVVYCQTLFAGDVPSCEDAFSNSCVPGKFEDGTGMVDTSIANKDEGTRTSEAQLAADNFLSNKFKGVLKKQNTKFRNDAIAAFKLNNTTECRGANVYSEACEKVLLANLNTMANRAMMGSSVDGVDWEKKTDLEYLKRVFDSREFGATIAGAYESLGDQFYDRAKFKKLREQIFPQVKGLILQKISALPIDETQKSAMAKKVKSIYFTDDGCGTGVFAFVQVNAGYLPDSNALNICYAVAQKNISEFALVQVIGHELAHSIDPCQVQFGNEGGDLRYRYSPDLKKMDDQYPIKGLLSCLRSPKSMAAAFDKDQPISKKAPFCFGDQAGESVADWFGAEVTASYISKNYPQLTSAQWQTGIANIFRQYCGGTKPDHFDVHPELKARVNTILLTHPIIREKMGCSKPNSKFVYCDAENPDAMTKAISVPTVDSSLEQQGVR